MTQVIVVRHGETEWNVSEIFRGRHDIGLNETGIKQAELLGNYLMDLRIKAIYSSPLKRALDTARSTFYMYRTLVPAYCLVRDAVRKHSRTPHLCQLGSFCTTQS
jgi:bisphosphoglycerate-dependent phosphoglycerate mutase